MQLRTSQMLDEPQKSEPDSVGHQFSDKWIAWDEDAQHIIASGKICKEAEQKAVAAGVREPFLEKVPPLDAGFAGIA